MKLYENCRLAVQTDIVEREISVIRMRTIYWTVCCILVTGPLMLPQDFRASCQIYASTTLKCTLLLTRTAQQRRQEDQKSVQIQAIVY